MKPNKHFIVVGSPLWEGCDRLLERCWNFSFYYQSTVDGSWFINISSRFSCPLLRRSIHRHFWRGLINTKILQPKKTEGNSTLGGEWSTHLKINVRYPTKCIMSLLPGLKQNRGRKRIKYRRAKAFTSKRYKSWISAGCSHKNGYNVISLSRLTLMYLFEQKIFKYHYHIKKRQERIIDILSEPIYLKVLSYYFLP